MTATMLESILDRLAADPGYLMNAEEASTIWAERSALVAGNHRAQTVLLLNDRLTAELTRGTRCGVCGRANDDACVERC